MALRLHPKAENSRPFARLPETGKGAVKIAEKRGVATV